MKIAVAGTGDMWSCPWQFCGQNHEVTAVDVIPERSSVVTKGKSPIRDKEIKE